ncbi:hypothetical protein KCM76_00840 [Zooshikella marina]|uniref:hypothetical protein n=1 Tax=Zooshikella ganghwensis TaxID=202772 RepID=UPI001BB09896|nr:hypothetical protein [Zooshikella ganghwensis]MBU2704507.1 hypothetical protein [Zooshikella ganghwensis]
MLENQSSHRQEEIQLGKQGKVSITEYAIEKLDLCKNVPSDWQENFLEERLVVTCDKCESEFTTEVDATSQNCPFCDNNIESVAHSRRLIKPGSLLTFKINNETATKRYKAWLKGLWLAPNSLKRKAKLEMPIEAVYIPYWTYDAETVTNYKGQRGSNYYTSSTHTRINSEGKQETYTKRCQRTRWRSASGKIANSFDDVLVLASNSLPRDIANELEPWDLENLVPYQDKYLLGVKAQSYQLDLKQGFIWAKMKIKEELRTKIKKDIGGDTQRIAYINTEYSNIYFKHLLLPIWLSSYRYKDKIYRFLINARTGEVQGERPYSKVKIALLQILGTMCFMGGVIVFEHFRDKYGLR